MSVDLDTVGGQEYGRGYAGQPADPSECIVQSRTLEGSAALPFGRVAAVGASGGCVLLSSEALKVAGLAVKQPMTPATSAGVVAYQPGDSVSLLKLGTMFVLAAEAYRDGDQVIGIVAGSGTIGSSAGGIANGSTRITVPGAYFQGAGNADTIAKIIVAGPTQTITATS